LFDLCVLVGFYGITTGKSIGSGTIIDEDGTILTCAHVVVDFQGMRGSSKGKVSGFEVLYVLSPSIFNYNNDFL
jgi:hypothetical protein